MRQWRARITPTGRSPRRWRCTPRSVRSTTNGSAKGCTPFELGLGLSTGTVAAALLGSEERVEYTLVGDVVNLCQRLQQFAQPGETVLSEATWNSLTATPDRFEQLGEQLVKGRDTPVIAYRLPCAGQPEPQPMGASS